LNGKESDITIEEEEEEEEEDVESGAPFANIARDGIEYNCRANAPVMSFTVLRDAFVRPGGRGCSCVTWIP